MLNAFWSDGNRGALLEAGFPQAIVSVLEGYAELVPSPVQRQPLPLSIAHLKVIRTAIGVLLNACVGFGMYLSLKNFHSIELLGLDAVKFRLLSVEAVLTILKLSTSIYPPGSWQYYTLKDEESPESIHESWTLRSGLSNWAWRTTTELRDVSDECTYVSTSCFYWF